MCMCNLNCQDCTEGVVETAILPNNIGWLEQILSSRKVLGEKTETNTQIWLYFSFYSTKNKENQNIYFILLVL